MLPQLRDISPTTTTTNLPNQFNLGEAATVTATTATIMAPPEALPQRERFRVNNVTQPFTVDQNNENYPNQPPPQVLQQERTTTSSFRRQQRRRRQQQYRQIDNNNRFAVLSDHDDNDNDNDNDIVDDDKDDDTDDPVSTNRNKKMTIKNKKPSKINEFISNQLVCYDGSKIIQKVLLEVVVIKHLC